jgi:hypothetical protein
VGGQWVLTTRDNWEHWVTGAVSPQTDNFALTDIALDGTTGVGIAVGDHGARLAADPPKYSVYVKQPGNSVREKLGGSIEIEIETVDDEGENASVSSLEYNVLLKDRKPEWRKLSPGAVKSITDGKWRLTWTPGDEAIGPNTTIEHRVFLNDGGSPLLPISLNGVVFMSLVDQLSEYKATLWTVSGVCALAALYLVPILTLYWFMPARLALGGGSALEAVGSASEGTSPWTKLIATLLRQLALPWFKKRPRVRDAWLRAYRQGAAGFKDLAPEVRAAFLDDIDVLDAWVALRIDAVREAISHLQLYRARDVFIPFPVRRNDHSIESLVEQPTPQAFFQVFKRERVVVSIIGEGGTGKTTLACAFARWAMDGSENELFGRTAIPVIIAEETNELLATVTATLNRMVGSMGELDPDIVAALLKHKRALVIIDALSERSTETQEVVNRLYASNTPINALIVTARRELTFGPVDTFRLYPEPISLRLLVPFILEYLRRHQLTERFDPQQQLALAQRILEIVETGGGLNVTPLLVTLFIDSAVNRPSSISGDETLPLNVPEVYLDYLERLNPNDPGTPNRVENSTLQQAAFIVAQTSLGSDFVPTDFLREECERRLRDEGFETPNLIVDRLISNGLIQERRVAGLSLLRFQFDPVSEYLTAIYFCRTIGSNEEKWTNLVGQLTSIRGYPEEIRGLLKALSVCYASYQLPLRLPRIQFPWKLE